MMEKFCIAVVIVFATVAALFFLLLIHEHRADARARMLVPPIIAPYQPR